MVLGIIFIIIGVVALRWPEAAGLREDDLWKGFLAILAGLIVIIGSALDGDKGGVEKGTTVVTVSADRFGDEWPLIVDGGSLRCEPPGAVIFRYNGSDFGVNGMAENLGYPPH